MLKHLAPATIAKPLGRYSHAVEVPAGARWLYLAGQVGLMPDGKLAEGFEGQTEQAFKNVGAALAAAGMGFADVVKVNYLLTDSANIAALRKIRDRFLLDPPPAATLAVIKALASSELLFEIEVVAAKS